MRENIRIENDFKSFPEFNAAIAMAVYAQDRIDWVECALNSLLLQSYQKSIIIVIIDGNIEDKLFLYLKNESNKYPRVFLLKSENNIGLSACMNIVIDWIADKNPKYFFRMDSDDISDPDRVKQQLEFFQNNNHISILGSGLIEINEQGKRVGQRKLPLEHDEIVCFLPKRCSINHPTVAIRYEIFSKGFRYREELKNTQDYFLWIDLAHAGFKFANLKSKLIKFRRVNDFYKRRGFTKSLNEFRARFYAMKKLEQYSLGNIGYAVSVLILRMMPAKIVKMAYKIDRFFLNRRVKH